MSEQLPTPETHHYVGMWRPPLDQIWPGDGHYLRCPCGSHFSTLIWWWDYVGNERKHLSTHCAENWAKVHEHWLAGHFDIPQYEPKVPSPNTADEKCMICHKSDADGKPLFKTSIKACQQCWDVAMAAYEEAYGKALIVNQ